jgi:ABC-2 type transport system permease protein
VIAVERPRTFSEWAAYYRALCSVGVAQYLAYRGAAAIWTLGLIAGPLVTLAVWTSVAKSNGGQAGGYTTAEYAAYFVLLMVVDQLTFTWQAWEQESRVRTGHYSPLLLRPVHPIHSDVTTTLTNKAFGLLGVIPAAVLLSLVFDARYDGSLWGWMVFLPTIVFAILLRFILEWTSGLVAFWVTKTAAMLSMYTAATGFLAGYVAPLTLFPEPVQIIAFVLPFQWMVYFPVHVALGGVEKTDIVVGIGMQLAWITASILLLRTVWQRAIVRYSAVGA